MSDSLSLKLVERENSGVMCRELQDRLHINSQAKLLCASVLICKPMECLQSAFLIH